MKNFLIAAVLACATATFAQTKPLYENNFEKAAASKAGVEAARRMEETK